LLSISLAQAVGISEEIIKGSIGTAPFNYRYFANLPLCNCMNVNKLRALFHRDAYYQLFIDSDFRNARKSLVFYLRYGKPAFNFVFLVRTIKILLVPGQFIMMVRKLKSFITGLND
jgi:hypothetical protein